MARGRSAQYGNVQSSMPSQWWRVIVPDCRITAVPARQSRQARRAPCRTFATSVPYLVVINQLGVKQAYYLAIRWGRHTRHGYALTWPEAWQGLRSKRLAAWGVSARGHCPRRTRRHRVAPSFARDFEKWKPTWDQTGILAAEIGRSSRTSATSAISRT